MDQFGQRPHDALKGAETNDRPSSEEIGADMGITEMPATKLPALSNGHGSDALRRRDDAVAHPTMNPLGMGRTPCHCVGVALSLLEKFESSKVQPQKMNKDHTLFLTKRAIVEGNRILNCETCNISSSFMILVIVVGEKVISMLEGTKSMSHANWGRGEGSVQEGLQKHLGGSGPVMLGVLPLNETEELDDVFEVLAIRQCKDLGLLMGRLRSSAVCWKWETHIAMIEPLEQRIRDRIHACESPVSKIS